MKILANPLNNTSLVYQQVGTRPIWDWFRQKSLLVTFETRAILRQFSAKVTKTQDLLNNEGKFPHKWGQYAATAKVRPKNGQSTKKYGLRRRKGCPDPAASGEALHQTHQKPHTAVFPACGEFLHSWRKCRRMSCRASLPPSNRRVSPPHHDNIIYLTGGPGRRAVIRSLSCRKGESL